MEDEINIEELKKEAEECGMSLKNYQALQAKLKELKNRPQGNIIPINGNSKQEKQQQTETLELPAKFSISKNDLLAKGFSEAQINAVMGYQKSLLTFYSNTMNDLLTTFDIVRYKPDFIERFINNERGDELATDFKENEQNIMHNFSNEELNSIPEFFKLRQGGVQSWIMYKNVTYVNFFKHLNSYNATMEKFKKSTGKEMDETQFVINYGNLTKAENYYNTNIKTMFVKQANNISDEQEFLYASVPMKETYNELIDELNLFSTEKNKQFLQDKVKLLQNRENKILINFYDNYNTIINIIKKLYSWKKIEDKHLVDPYMFNVMNYNNKEKQDIYTVAQTYVMKCENVLKNVVRDKSKKYEDMKSIKMRLSGALDVTESLHIACIEKQNKYDAIKLGRK